MTNKARYAAACVCCVVFDPRHDFALWIILQKALVTAVGLTSTAVNLVLSVTHMQASVKGLPLYCNPLQ